MPHRKEDDARNVVLNYMNKPYTEYALSDAELSQWDKLISVRDDVNGVIETARAAKRIGKPLEAAVTLRVKDESAKDVVEAISSMNLSELFIVSSCLITEDELGEQAATGMGSNNPGLEIAVSEAPGVKCPRCWMHSVDADPETGLCR